MHKGKLSKHKLRNDRIRLRWVELNEEKPRKSKEEILDILAEEFIDYNLSKRRIEDIAYGAD